MITQPSTPTRLVQMGAAERAAIGVAEAARPRKSILVGNRVERETAALGFVESEGQAQAPVIH